MWLLRALKANRKDRITDTGHPPGPPPHIGVWGVEPRVGQDGRKDIFFKVVGTRDVTPEQMELKNLAERTLTALHAIYKLPSDEVRFSERYEKLLLLSQLGLVGSNPKPGVAKDALRQLQEEVVELDASRIKGSFLRLCGKWAAIFAAPSLLAAWILSVIPPFVQAQDLYRNACILWAGSMAGTWLSIATRKLSNDFFDLARLEDDHIDPPIRFIFSGLLTVIFGSLLLSEVIEVKIGNFIASSWATSAVSALVLGALAGFGEKGLPARMSGSADKLFSTK